MNQENTKLSTLILDDDPVYRNLVSSILSEKLRVFTAEKPSDAFNIMKEHPVDFLICDFKLPEMNGLEVLDRVKQEYPDTEVIMISNKGDMDTVIGALRKGAVDYFKKPFSAEDLWISIERTLKYAELNNNLTWEKKKNVYLNEEISKELGVTIVSKSQKIEKVKQQMKMVAQTPDTSVMIIGESGTGKELVARGIHYMSSRKHELFGAVNMSAIPESLFESEFFGHKKGSFTGAVADKSGWFETTNQGTLFLDEIGEMSMALQVKLLRVLEDKKYTKVGSQKDQQFDTRIITATNKPIEELNNGKMLRLDLFHRLGTFIISLPPLRERKSDLPELTHYFLNEMAQKLDKQIHSIDPAVFDILEKYQFPGNIRELKNLIERAVIVCQGEKLLPEHFNTISLLDPYKDKPAEMSSDIFDLQTVEKTTIIKALQKTNHNKAEAARLLGIDWNALYRRIQKYGLNTNE